MNVLVLGNGKSLQGFDFRRINTDWVGCCLAFRYWNKINIHPTMYVNVDRVVCEKNLEVKEYVQQKKCKKYLLSETIKNIWPADEQPKDGSIVFIEDLMKNTNSIFKFANNYCSGSSAVLFALDHYNHVNTAGFDCDYVEFIPECEKLPDGSLKISKTPKYNPNYFFNDYQREGDIYNVPNGKRVHLRSWEELSHILKFMKSVFNSNKNVLNFNNKKSISQFITTLPLDNLFTDTKERIAFLVPSTSNKRDWNNFRETYLNNILLPSITGLSHTFNITIYIGYDNDDRLYSNISLPEKYDNLSLKWIPFEDTFKGKPTHIWNVLANTCINDGFDYFQVCGDDIRFDPDTNWLRIFIQCLKENNNIGYSAGFSNNTEIPTQFLLHKKHYKMFGWVFPPQITDWQCDDFIYHLYGRRFGNWLKQYNHYNVGGEPRYTPTNPVKLREMLVKRNKKILSKHL